MSKLLNKIETMRLQARQNGVVVDSSLLTTLLGEVQTIGKNEGGISDAIIVATVQKFIKNLNIVLMMKPDDANASKEIEILNELLPKQLSDDDIIDIITMMKAKGENLGGVMKYFKAEHMGEYEGSKVSYLFKSLT